MENGRKCDKVTGVIEFIYDDYAVDEPKKNLCQPLCKLSKGSSEKTGHDVWICPAFIDSNSSLPQ